jgi:ABC-type multidrug transport system permease subunit
VFNLIGIFFCVVLLPGFGFVTAIQPIIAIERLVYYRERGAGMYSPLTYALAQFSIECPYVFFYCVIFIAIVYSMIQFQWEYAKVLWFFFFEYCNMLFFVYWGMISVAATPNPQAAVILATFPFSLFSLFSGFPITRKQMPVWWRWFYWCIPQAWGLYGLAGSQLGDVKTFVALPDEPDQNIRLEDYLRSYFGFDHSFLKYVAIEQVALAVTLAFIFAICIKNCNFQRR